MLALTEARPLEIPKHDADDAARARDTRACDELLALLKLHHPEQNPIKEVAPEPEPEPIIEPEEPPPPAVPTVRDIQLTVCWYFNVPHLALLSHRRTNEINFPRQVAMWLTKTLTMKTLPQIGRTFSDRDHTTILHAVRKIENLRQTDEQISQLCAHLMGVIQPR